MTAYRWSYPKRQLVEDSHILSADGLTRGGHLRPGARSVVQWTRGDGEPRRMLVIAHRDYVHLSYAIFDDFTGEARPYSYTVDLRFLDSGFISNRPHFVCPGCEGPVRKLYLPCAGRWFLCRSCHGLTYRLRQDRSERARRAWARQLGD
jgi:hypothetical protein